MGIKYARLVADMFLFCYERDLVGSPSYDTHADIIEVFNSTFSFLATF